ncbi:MAG: AsmA family protein [Acidobacteriota bacterium]
MGRKPRIALLVVAAAAALLLLVFLALPFLISSDRFLPLLEEQASAAIGLPVKIDHLRLKPGLGLRLQGGGVRVGGRENAPDLTVEEFGVGLRLWPLVRGEVRLGRVNVKGVVLRLQRLPQSRGWGIPGVSGASLPGQATPRVKQTRADSDQTAAADLPVDRIDLRDVRVVFIDPEGPAGLREGVTLGPARVTLERQGGGAAWRFEIGVALGGTDDEKVKLSGEVPLSGVARTHVLAEVLDVDVETLRPLLLVAGVQVPEVVHSGVARGSIEFHTSGAQEGSGAVPGLLDGVVANGSLDLSDLKVKLGEGPRFRMLAETFHVAMEFSLEGGALQLEKLSTSLYGGELNGTGSLNPFVDPMPFSLQARASRIDLAGALPALSADLEGLLTGRFSGEMKLEGQGLTQLDLSRNLRGGLSLDLRDGELMSVSILRQVAKLLEVAGGRGIGKETTPYDSIRGDFDIRSGKAHTRNLTVRSQDLDLDGEGTFGLDATLDFDVVGRFSPEVSREMVAETSSLRYLVGEDERLEIRFRLHGPLAGPSVQIDQAQFRKGLKRAAEEKGKEKLLEKLKGLFR